MNERMNGWMNVQMNIQMGGRMDGWMDDLVRASGKVRERLEKSVILF